jgi:hypothetical protein
MKGYCTMTSIGNYGRFANALFQVAGVFGVSRKNGLAPVFPLLINHDHRDRFGSKEDCDLYKHFVNSLPCLPSNLRWQERPVQWGYEDVRLQPGNWNISGHFQSFKYFEHCADEVKWYMRMKNEESTKLCALHYRAGDYEKGPNVYHPRMPIHYYASACEHFPADQKYLVFSDDRKEVEAMCKELRIKYTIANGRDYIEDFRLMKGCKDFIISNSSYSAMAAWLGDASEKKVVSPSGYNWFGTQAQITGDSIIHPDWVQIRFDKTKIYA